MPAKKKNAAPRQFYGFTEGQEVIDNRTGISYSLYSISMNGHANLIAKVYRKVRDDYTEWSDLPLSRLQA